MKTILIFIMLCSVTLVRTQELPNVLPHSPEVATLSKFQATPVSYYTGIPSITIPLLTLEGRSLNLPISIGYHAGGVRVFEDASNVGLGWSLFAGGQITRAVKGMPDERFYLTTTDVKVSDYENLPFLERMDVENAVRLGINDLEPDQFNYSFLGYSGKFMFNQNRTLENPYGQIIHMPESDLRITPIILNNQIEFWEVITPDGTKYIFNSGKERLVTASDNIIDRTLGILFAPTTQPMSNYYTAWRLSSIETHTGDVINFEYESYQVSQCTFGSETYNGLDSQLTNVDDDYESHIIATSYVTVESSRITRITSSKGEVEFFYGLREDIVDADAKRLEEILVSGADGKELERIRLEQSYFQSTIPQGNELTAAQLISCGIGGFDEQADTKRLKLDGIHITGLYNNGNSTTGYRYGFEYSTIPLPHKKSYAQDFWGYYNGETSNLNLIPQIPHNNYPFENIDLEIQANRYVNPNYTQAGILTKITYPEGGYEEFQFENNKSATSNFRPGELDFVSPPDLQKRITLNTTTDSFYAGHETDPATGLTIYRYKKTVEIGDDILNNGLVEFSVYSTACFGSGGNIIPGNECLVTGGFRAIGDVLGPISFIMDMTSNPYLQDTTNVTPGTYEIYANIIATDFPINGGELDLKVEWRCPNDLNFDTEGEEDLFYIGGLRIKEKTTYDDDNTPISKTTYNYNSILNTDISVPVFAEPLSVVIDYCANSYTADVTRFNSSPVFPLITNQGGFVGYQEVTERIQGYDPVNQSFETLPVVQNTYTFAANARESYRGSPVDYPWKRGYLEDSNLNGQQTRNTIHTNSTNVTEFLNNNYVEGYEGRYLPLQTIACSGGTVNIYRNVQGPAYKFIQHGGYSHLTNTTETRKESNGDIIIQRSYEYNADIEQPTKITTDYGNGTIHTEFLTYTSSGVNIPELTGTLINALESRNRKELVKRRKEDQNGALLSAEITKYPLSISGSDPVLPEGIQTQKSTEATLEERLRFISYTSYGLPEEVAKQDGPSNYYIWGYNDSYPIAKLDNFQSTQITGTVQSLIQAAVNASNNDDSLQDEATLRVALSNLRNASELQDTMVTSYTYDPLVGVTSTTDPKGYTHYYEYDELRRLKTVKDQDEHLLEEYEYNYKNQ
ncbi:MAG: hypothetical protein AAF717_08345 [Bacteroidota bacterium]